VKRPPLTLRPGAPVESLLKPRLPPLEAPRVSDDVILEPNASASDPCRVEPFVRSRAVRGPEPMFWERAADFLGFRSLPPAVAAVGSAITVGLRDKSVPGAPMVGEHIVGPALLTHALSSDLGELRAGRFPRGLFGRHSPQQLALLDAMIGEGRGPAGARSLREALHQILRGAEELVAIRALDAAAARVRRPPGQELHDLSADPSGLAGPSRDGRLPATIDKILELRRLRRLSASDLVTPHEVTAGNHAQVIPGGGKIFDAMLSEIGRATDSVHLAFFIIKEGRRCDQLVDALVAKAKEGVPVRIIMDERGELLAHQLGFTAIIARLRAGGVDVQVNWILPGHGEEAKLTGPDHRKVVIIDGKVAFTGGFNVGDDYLDQWHDVGIRVEGPSARQIQSEWMLTWLALGGAIDPGASDDVICARYFPEPPTAGHARLKVAGTVPGASDEIRRATLQLIDGARRSIDIENPYITNAEVQAALLAAAERGVAVRLLIPADNNHGYCDLVARAHFPALLAAGAEIRELPGMSHGKLLLVDDRRGWIGTSNLDDLSLRKIYELDVLFDDVGVATQAKTQIFEPDARRARALSPEDITSTQLALGHFWSLFRGNI
jgi:cardiolipin synthase